MTKRVFQEKGLSGISALKEEQIQCVWEIEKKPSVELGECQREQDWRSSPGLPHKAL